MRRIVLERGDHVAAVGEGGVALEPAHGGHAQPRHQIRILAERLLHAPPPRLAGDVHHGRQRLVRAARPRLGGGHRVEPLDQAGVERRAKTDRLRETGALLRRLAVQALLVEDHRDAEPRLLDEEPLNRVGQLGHRPRAQAAARVARPPNLPEAVSVAEVRAGFAGVEPALLVDEQDGLLPPHAHHLRDFLLERHPREQVGGALVRVPCPVLVRQRFCRGAHRDASTG